MTVDFDRAMAKTGKSQDDSNSTTATLRNTEQTATNERPDPERVSARAYELYLARGGADGQAWEDWLAAERELSDAAVPQTDRDE